ncbi:hypothetical protein [Beggiatoa alba]|nr:hypothetical protein [Beggiatoa alba]
MEHILVERLQKLEDEQIRQEKELRLLEIQFKKNLPLSAIGRDSIPTLSR